MKKGGGRRYFRRDDILLLQGIRHLLYDCGQTIKKVQARLRDGDAAQIMALGDAHGAGPGTSKKPAAIDPAPAPAHVEDVEPVDTPEPPDPAQEDKAATKERLETTMQNLLAARARLKETLQKP